MPKDVIHISEAEAASDFAALMARVRAGAKVIIENGARPVAVLHAAEPVRRSLLKRKLHIWKRSKDRLGSPLTLVSYVLPLAMVEVREYLDKGGHSPFAAWSDRLNREAAAKVAAALARIQQGNLSNAKGVG